MSSQSQIRGFTLIELLVTVSVIAIVATIAVPSFRNLLVSNRAQAQAYALVTDLNYARAEAVRRRQNVEFAASSDGDWHLGWSIRAGGTELRRQDGLVGGATVSAGGQEELIFDRDGRASAATTFRYCLPDGLADFDREISVNALGRISVNRTPCP